VGETCDLLDDLGGGVQVDETLVDPHLESVPSLGTLTTRTASRGNSKGNGRMISQLPSSNRERPEPARLILTTSWW